MAKKRNLTRPRATVTPEQWDTATRADSASCLIADAFRREYPELTNWRVDLTQIRATDKAAGVRRLWLIPADAQNLLLAFDQGWSRPQNLDIALPKPVQEIRIRAANRAEVEQRRQRLPELEAKEVAGTITGDERRALAGYRSAPERPTSQGPVERVTNSRATIVGGRAPATGKKNPALLASTTRAYGARLAKPGVAFQQAVEHELARRLAERADGPADAVEHDADPSAEGSR